MFDNPILVLPFLSLALSRVSRNFETVSALVDPIETSLVFEVGAWTLVCFCYLRKKLGKVVETVEPQIVSSPENWEGHSN